MPSRALLAKIHIAKKQLGLDEVTYRDVLARVSGKHSAKDLSDRQCTRLIGEFERLGFKEPSKPSRKPLTGSYAKKLQALWIAAWNLGLVKNRDDKALLAFIKRQTGIEHTQFLRAHADAARAIECLKAWLARAGVEWRDFSDERFCIIDAQCRLLGLESGFYMQSSTSPVETMNTLGRLIRGQNKKRA